MHVRVWDTVTIRVTVTSRKFTSGGGGHQLWMPQLKRQFFPRPIGHYGCSLQVKRELFLRVLDTTVLSIVRYIRSKEQQKSMNTVPSEQNDSVWKIIKYVKPHVGSKGPAWCECSVAVHIHCSAARSRRESGGVDPYHECIHQVWNSKKMSTCVLGFLFQSRSRFVRKMVESSKQPQSYHECRLPI